MQNNTNKIITELIPLIETFDYLSGRANGERIYNNEHEACERHPHLKKKIKGILHKSIEFERELDEAIHVDESELHYFFKDLSTHCSIARMLMMPYTFMGKVPSNRFFFEELVSMNSQQRIKKMRCHMQNFDNKQDFSYESLVEHVMKLPISGMSKLSIVECYNNYEQNCERLGNFIRPIVEIVGEKLVRFDEDVRKWERDIQEVGDVCTYVSEHSRFMMPDGDFTIFPSVHNGLMLALYYWDKSICIGEEGRSGEMWLGLGFRDYMEGVSSESGTSRVVGIFSGLSDEIRFEIIKTIAQRKIMSGSEIADKFGLTRQKVFYHMSKLLTLGLVECNAESGRPYYTLNKQSLEEVIAAISMLVNEE